MRLNKTVGNLKTVWKQLDESCGLLDNAIINLTSMRNLDQEMINDIERAGLAFQEIVSLKNEVEEMIENKKNQKNSKDEWHFIHDEITCSKCSKGEDSFYLKYYEGIYKGNDAQKYICSNPECNYEEIKTYDQLYEEEYGNKLD
jgi:hypothetical protein